MNNNYLSLLNFIVEFENIFNELLLSEKIKKNKNILSEFEKLSKIKYELLICLKKGFQKNVNYKKKIILCLNNLLNINLIKSNKNLKRYIMMKLDYISYI